ncbi:MAG: FtsW/RodA/SpoVE family cell cycle protein, partial [Eubacteriales bacterium]
MRKIRQVDGVLLGTIAVLIIVGIVMTYSSSVVKGYLYYNDPYHFFKMELLWVVLGIVAMSIAVLINWRVLYKWSKPLLYIGLVMLLLVKIPGIGRTVNGADRWIGIGPLSIQPSEAIKLAMVIFVAKMLSQNPRSIASFRNGVAPILLLMGFSAGLIMLQPDLGTTLVLVGVTFFMLIAAGARVWHIFALGGSALLLVIGAIVAAPYRMRRIFAFLDPWADPSGKGYQTIQSLLALG